MAATQETVRTVSPRTAQRVMVVTNHRTLRQALCAALESRGLEVTVDTRPGREALVAAITNMPHVVLVDASSDATLALDTCRQFRKAAVNTRLVALVPRIGPEAHASRTAGFDAVVTTDTTVDDLAGFIESIGCPQRSVPLSRRGRPPARLLSNREHEVLSLAASGLTDVQMAEALYVSTKTVKNHLHNLYGKLGARSRTEAVVIAARQGLITL